MPPGSMQVHTPITLRKALLVIDFQNEFLLPSGRCKINNISIVDTVRSFLPAFRAQPNTDVIWVRSEFKSARNAQNPANDELIISDLGEKPVERQVPGKKGSKKAKKGPTVPAKLEPSSTSNPDSIEEFLADEQNPCCAPSSLAAQFHDSILSEVQTTTDRVIIKSWYSAFKETLLTRFLRGRFISELYICGVKTNASVIATASDAVKHGLDVTILTDCLGYSNEKLHEAALNEMTEILGVEVSRSSTLIMSWTAKSKGKLPHTRSESQDVSKEELEEMLEKMTLNNGDQQIEFDPSHSDANKSGNDADGEAGGTKQRTKRSKRTKQTADELASKLDELVSKKKTKERPALAPGGSKHKKATSTSEGKPLTSPKQKPMPSEMPSKLRASSAPVLREGDIIGEGDCKLVNNVLPEELAEDVFEKLKKEVRWRTMYHRGGEVPRLVAVQGEGEDEGSIPIYRHPADESPPLRPFSPTVSLIRNRVEEVLKHPVNHVLIQYYRDGRDYISEHSDKTLDIVKGSMIVNVSVGAQRTMILRTKSESKHWNGNKEGSDSERMPPPRRSKSTPGAPRQSQRVPLPHNSMFVLGPTTNKKWLHAIKQDKRLPSLKSPEETDFAGERISLTFRNIGTFLQENETKIYGQGAISKSKEGARPVVNDSNEAERMILAFGKENHESDEFDWEKWYGYGFDVLHVTEKLPELRFPASHSAPGSWLDQVDTMTVLSALNEKQIKFGMGRKEENDSPSEEQPREITFIDSDLDKTVVEGAVQILLYLETFYSGDARLGSKPEHHKPLLPHPQRYERTAYATVLGALFESQRLKATVQAFKEDLQGRLTQNQAGDEHKASHFPAKIALEAELVQWESFLRHSSRGILVENPNTYLAPAYITSDDREPMFSAADCAVWPILWKLKRLEETMEDRLDWASKFNRLDGYLSRCIEREGVKKVLQLVDKEKTTSEEPKEPKKEKNETPQFAEDEVKEGNPTETAEAPLEKHPSESSASTDAVEKS